jgi:hypothetical protein
MMRSTLVFLLLLVTAVVPAMAAHRATWTWERESYAMLEDPAFADQAIAFLQAQQVDTVYLYADAYQGRNLIQAHPEAYRALILHLHRKGMQAYALLGSAYLHTEAYILPERREDALSMFRRVLAYNAAAAPEERFDGINLDIEPHILDQWDTQRDKLLGDFLDMGQALMEEKRKSGLSLRVGPAIAFWLDGIQLDWHGRRRPVSEHVQDIYDYVAVMDYRDHAAGGDGMIGHVENEMDYARAHGKRVVIGIDVSAGEPQKVSFDHLTPADMARELGLVEQAYGDDPAFDGFAIHHFRAYQDWVARGGHSE